MSDERFIVQLPLSGSTDFDELIEIENGLTLAFLKERVATVERHGLTGNSFNIFIVPRAASGPVVDRIKAVLAESGVLDEAIIATRKEAREPWSVLWPDGHNGTIDV